MYYMTFLRDSLIALGMSIGLTTSCFAQLNDSIPVPPNPPPVSKALSNSSEAWVSYRSSMDPLIENGQNQSKSEEIVALSIGFLLEESKSLLSNRHIYNASEVIVEQRTDEGLVFLLMNIDLNADGFYVSSDFYSNSCYPVHIALYKQARLERSQLTSDMHYTSKRVVEIILNNHGNVIGNCDLSDTAKRLLGFYLRAYGDRTQELPLLDKTTTSGCAIENLAAIIKYSRVRLEVDQILNPRVRME